MNTCIQKNTNSNYLTGKSRPRRALTMRLNRPESVLHSEVRVATSYDRLQRKNHQNTKNHISIPSNNGARVDTTN